MPKGMLYVETRPKDPSKADEYHTWYDEVHLREVVAAGGFISARRFAPIDEDGPFVAMFEFDDDIGVVQERVARARSTGDLSPSQAEVITVRFLRELGSHEP